MGRIRTWSRANSSFAVALPETKINENTERNQKSVAKNLCANFPIKPGANIITGKSNARWGLLPLMLQDMRDSTDKNFQLSSS